MIPGRRGGMADEAVLAQVLEGAVPALPRRAAQELTRFVRCGSIHDVCRSMGQTSLERESHR
jgi:hypothetical protein